MAWEGPQRPVPAGFPMGCPATPGRRRVKCSNAAGHKGPHSWLLQMPKGEEPRSLLFCEGLTTAQYRCGLPPGHTGLHRAAGRMERVDPW